MVIGLWQASVYTWIQPAILYIFLVVLLFFGIKWLSQRLLLTSPVPENSVKGRGYCQETAPYHLPVEHPNFISPAECDYILKQATPHFSDSLIVSGSDANIRKSKTAWLPKVDPVISKIIRRVCAMTHIPFEHAEKMQVVRYEPNGYYNEHHDAACDDRQECVDFEQNGGQRKITMLIYLSDDYEGGATRFPRLNKDYRLPKCGALMFHPLEKEGNKCHPLALHAGMPVTSGIKYIANVWLREGPYNTEL